MQETERLLSILDEFTGLNPHVVVFCPSGHPDPPETLRWTRPAGSDTQYRLLAEGAGSGRRGLSITVSPEELETSR